MQLADSVSVAKIKIIYASRQHAHSEPGVHSYKKKVYIAGLGRDQLEQLASPMTKSETSPSPNKQRVQDKSETIGPDSSTTALLSVGCTHFCITLFFFY